MWRASTALLQRLASSSSASSSSSCATAAPQQVFTRGIQYFDAPNGPAVSQTPIEDEWYNRQRTILPLLDKRPWIESGVWIAPNAVVVGDVDLYDEVAVFYGAVVRGDLNKIRIGRRTAVLDRAVIHAARAVPTGLNPATLIGEHVTIEPYSILRSCRIGDRVLIGARSVVCEGAIVEPESILTPGSVVPPARRIPSGELWGGNPLKFIRKLTENERERVTVEAAEHYTTIGQSLRAEELPVGTQWREIESYREKLVSNKEYEWIDFRQQKYLMRLHQEAEDMAKLSQ